MVLKHVLMPAVAGQFPYARKTLGFIVKRLSQQGRERIVWSPEKTAHVMNTCFPKQFQYCWFAYMYRSLAIVLGIIVLIEGQVAIGKEVDVDSASTIQYLLSYQKVNSLSVSRG